MKTVSITNSSAKALRVYSARGLAAKVGGQAGAVIAAGIDYELPVQDPPVESPFVNITLDANPHQWVLIWWKDDDAAAVGHADNRSPVLLSAQAVVLDNDCSVTIAAIGQQFEFPIAPGHPATLVVPPTTWSIAACVDRFQAIVDDEDLLTRGQFVWFIRLWKELTSRWAALLLDDGETRGALASVGDVAGGLGALFVHDAPGFEKLRSQAARAASSSAGQNGQAILAMLAPGGDGKPLYASATSWFRAGGNLRPTSPSDDDKSRYQALFQNPATLTFATAVSLWRKCAIECYGWAEAVNAHIDSRTLGEGMRGLKKARGQLGLDMPISYDVNHGGPPKAGDTRPALPPGAGHVLEYKTKLGGSTGDARHDGPIFNLLQNLDRGLLVTAYCLSGIKLDHAGNADNPLEHWLLILGYAQTAYGYKFPFWDPDARTSLRRDEIEGLQNWPDVITGEMRTVSGFGLLHFVAAGAVAFHADPPAAGAPEHFANGRFSTESENGGILVDPDGYHADAVGPWGFRRGEGDKQHRYQVGMLKLFPTGGA